MKKFLKITLLLLIIAGISVLLLKFATSSEKVIMNEGYVNGNTAGNLYNGGLFCEKDGIIYFANPSDSGRLYSMDSTGKNLTKLSEDRAIYINADDNYIYYIRDNLISNNLDFEFFAFHTNALCRMEHDGSNHEILDTEPSLYASLIGNYIYYIHYDKEDASTLYRVKIDGTEQQQIMKEAVYTCNAEGQYFYYNGMRTDGDIHRFDTSSNSTKMFYHANAFQPIVSNGNDIYYIDGESDYAIVHTNLQTDEPTYITKDSVDCYNIYGDTVYYQRFDKNGSALCMVNTAEGSEPVVLRNGDYCDIHVTSNFVFFREYHSQKMYYFPRTNPSDIKLFDPGKAEKKGLFD